jgi:hypothetical protein
VNLRLYKYTSDVPLLVCMLAFTVLVWSLIRQAVARHQASVDGLDLAWSMIGAHARMELFNRKLELFDRTTFAISSELTTSAQARRLVEMADSICEEYACVQSDYSNDERPARRDFTVHSDGGA